MASTAITVAAVAVGASAIVVAGSAAAVAYRYLSRDDPPERQAVLLEEKLRAYHELLAAIIEFNRHAVEMGEEQFGLEADQMALEKDSELDEPYRDVHQAFESNFHIIAPEVRRQASEFLDYPATYHEMGATLGGLLSQAGEVFTAMRADIGLASLFDAHVPAGDSDVETPDEMDSLPDFDEETEEFEDAPENVEDEMPELEDLEYFNPASKDRAD